MPKTELPDGEKEAADKLSKARDMAAQAELKPFNVYAFPIPYNPTEEQIATAQAELDATTPDWMTVSIEVGQEKNPSTVTTDPETGKVSNSGGKATTITTTRIKASVSTLAYAHHLLSQTKVEHFPALMEGAIFSPAQGTWRTFGKGEYTQTVETNATNEMGLWGLYPDSTITNVRRYLRRKTFIQKYGKHSPFDDSKTPELVAFSNGTYNIKTNEMQPHGPDNYILNAHDYNVDPANNKAPETEKLLTAMLGDAAITFEEYVGYMFYHSHAPFTELLWLSGSGGEGKSTLLKEVVGRMLGRDNYTAQNPQDLADPEKRFNTAELYGKEANIVADIADGFMKDTSIIKKLTGGDVMSAEFKGISGFTFINYGKQLYAANAMPSFSDGSNGFGDRAMIIKMINGDVRHGKAKEDFWGKHNERIDAVKAERSAFAMLCMQKFAAALKRGEFTKPESVRKASEEWLTANDHLAEFIDTGFLVKIGDDDYFVKASDFNRDFKTWCSVSGYSDKTGPAKIRARMELKGFKRRSKWMKDTGTLNYYFGLKSNDTFHF